jgi:dihydrofolate synthase/folylpolyglutamate synthase
VGGVQLSHGGTVNKVKSGFEYLGGLTPWNGRGGFDLDGIRSTLKRLGDPQDSLPTIHIAGTNGKGSVSAAVSSILAQSGYKVGLNSSPHLFKMNERIVVDGVPCSDEVLGEFAIDVREAANRAVVELSFHEAITAISFLAFRELGLDWSVIEVGLGGRLDASNIIKRPAATAIVTIDFDHQHILGDTLAKIAVEKAGIIKQGTPNVTGALPKEALEVVNRRAHGNVHYRYGKEFDSRQLSGVEVNRFEYWGKDFPILPSATFEFNSPLPGLHQGHNMAVAATLALLVGITPETCKSGIENLHWPARLESISIGGREFILDSAHNPAGIRAFLSYLRSKSSPQVDLTFGVLDTKNWQEMIKQLKPYVACWRLLLPDSASAVPLELVQEEIGAGVSGTGVRIVRYEKDYEGCIRDLIEENEGQPAYVAGSMYMVGRMRGMLSPASPVLWKRAN